MRATLLFLVLLGGATASAWAQDGSSGVAKPAKPKRQTNVISQEEIVAIQTEASDAFAVVSRLRPQFLRIRGTKESVGTSAPMTVKVVVDNATRGELESLHQIPTSTLKEIRYLNGTDASIQYGTNYGGGAILVFTR